jgi:hypothetical protein
VDGRIARPDASARGFGFDAGDVDVVFGMAILPYCKVPGLRLPEGLSAPNR